MKRKRLEILLLCLLAANCANGQASVDNPAPDKQSTGAQNAARRNNEKRSAADLKAEFERIARKSGGRVGVAATVLETGDTVSFNAGERFPLQSVYKLPIAMAIFSQVEAGKIKLDQKLRIEKDEVSKSSTVLSAEKFPNGVERSVEELLRLTVSESDNTASDALLKLAGGAGAVMNYLGELGIEEIVVANYEKELHADWQAQYRNYATPKAAIELLGALQASRGISEPNRARLLRFMIESPTGPRRLKGLLPAGTTVAHKTGTSGTRKNLTPATNDIGIVDLPDGRHLAVAVFVADSSADQTTREETIAKIARAAFEYWSEK
ncbi:MAG TPA: class A beta-lactamase [Pyrinomonadaceae bacterium]|jgi:beta-lactamase class A